MIRAVIKNALLLASLGGWLGVAQAAAEPELAAEASDVATLPPNPPHRFFTGGFRAHELRHLRCGHRQDGREHPGGLRFESGHRSR